MSTDQETLRRYDALRDDVRLRLARIEATLGDARSPGWFGKEADAAELQEAAALLARSRFVLAVVGEFSSGKSFLLNALLGKVRLEERPGAPPSLAGLLATDINPSTATITELEYSQEESATALYPSGRRERIPLDRLARFVAVAKDDDAALHDATSEDEGCPTHVRVAVDSPFLERGFLVADTPGLASINPAHRRATLRYLPGADAVLYLIDTQQPFTEGDASFLGIIRRHIESLFIVQTKVDLWRMPEAGGRAAWENAYRRIVAQASQHAPDTAVFPVSARDYAFGKLSGEQDLVEKSGFPEFLDALDRSLVATAGKARLTRALRAAKGIVERASGQLSRDMAALPLGIEALRAERARVEPLLANVAQALRERIETLKLSAQSRYNATLASGEDLADDLVRALALVVDTADIARVRDRNKLHILVDGAVARAVDHFAQGVASLTVAEVGRIAQTARADIVAAARDITSAGDANIVPEMDIGGVAAERFGQARGAGVWADDVGRAISASIVLSAIGGPAVGFVEGVAAQFATAPHGSYMKRELLQDLRTTILPAFRAEIAAFSAKVADALSGIYRDLAASYATLETKLLDAAVGTLDRAIETLERNVDSALRVAELEAQRSVLESELRALSGVVAGFQAPKLVIATTAETEAITRASVSIPFDRDAYDRGLRAERWRVVMLGAFHRGKSTLINAIAGTHVLGNAPPGVVGFPIHVRYGPVRRVYALRHDGRWEEVAVDKIVAEATNTPVLIEEPWKMPKELVLVHAPPFDTGDSRAEEICMVSARSASEILCLFSRQLSDRELDLYERVADLGKAMLFAHTMADNETAAERRQVVELAARYLKERGIKAERIFTISSREYWAALEAGRAPAGWNETGALVSTLESHAESHMARLAQNAREKHPRTELVAKVPGPAASEDPGIGGLFKKWFGR